MFGKAKHNFFGKGIEKGKGKKGKARTRKEGSDKPQQAAEESRPPPFPKKTRAARQCTREHHGLTESTDRCCLVGPSKLGKRMLAQATTAKRHHRWRNEVALRQ